MNAKVTRLQTAAIKGTRLRSVEQVTLGRSGAAGDRRFFLVDDRGRMVNSKVLGMLHTVSAGYVVGAMFVLSISAWYLLRGRNVDIAKRSMTVAARFGLASALSVVVLGCAPNLLLSWLQFASR